MKAQVRGLVGIIALGCIAAASPEPRVHVSDPAGALKAGLRAELEGEAAFVGTATAADLRVRLFAGGRRLAVVDDVGAPLVEREVAATGPAEHRVFVTLAAEAVRRWARARGDAEAADGAEAQSAEAGPSTGGAGQTGEPTAKGTEARAAGGTTPSSGARSAKGPARSARATEPDVEPANRGPTPGATTTVTSSVARRAGAAATTATPTPARGWWLLAAADARLWTTPRAPRFGLEVALLRRFGPWSVGLALLGGAGPDLSTREIEARLGALHVIARGERRGAVAEGLEVRAVLGAGVGGYFGRARAVEPAFADPGTPDGVALVDPVLWPGVGLVWRLAPSLEFSADVSVKIGLRVSSLTLPGTFSAPSEAPLRTDRVQPRLALGLAWALAGEKE